MSRRALRRASDKVMRLLRVIRLGNAERRRSKTFLQRTL